MSKYFVSYKYNVSQKVPSDGMGWTYDSYDLIEACNIELKEDEIDISKIQQHIHDVELSYRTNNRPDANTIEILELSKL